MFCDPEPEILGRVAQSEPLIALPSFDFKPPLNLQELPVIDISFGPFAGLGETCEGFNEFTGGPFPRCEKGLVCEDAGLITIPGAGNICKVPVVIALAGLGETCGGFNELTG